MHVLRRPDEVRDPAEPLPPPVEVSEEHPVVDRRARRATARPSSEAMP
ncbi:hypothetical protein [Streptomyces carpinensis]|nr:hypothetical protein [Streptomyces carpinensis]